MKWPELFDISKSGKIKTWKISTHVNIMTIEHGYLNGKITIQKKVITKGKNKGKKNETTPEHQVILEAQAKWDKQIKKGYVSDKASLNSVINYFPMLAKTAYGPNSQDVLSGKKKITKLPKKIIAQSKLNGVRALCVKKNNHVTIYSRNMEIYSVPVKLIAHLNTHMPNDTIWDGEIYVHLWEFNRILSAIKKYNKDTDDLQFHRYDVPSINESMENRAKKMADMYHDNIIRQVGYVVINENNNIDLWKRVKKWHDLWVSNNYEGIILRDAKAKYQWRYRGSRMLKYKEFTDEEFTIIGYKQGSGSNQGAICFKCRTECVIKDRLWPGQRYEYFDVVPILSIDNRKRMYKNGWKYIGKLYTVRFQERSVYNVPIFPKGVSTRDYE